MNKITIPVLLAVTVMIAGIFAFMPVEQASTVHTTVIAASSQLRTLEIDDAAGGLNAADVYTIDCTTDAIVHGITATLAGTITDEDLIIAQGGENLQVTTVFAAVGGQDLTDSPYPIPAAETSTITAGAMTDAGDEEATIKVAVQTANAGTCTFVSTP